MPQTLHEAAYELIMYDLKRAEAVASLMHQFGVSKEAANAAVTQAQKSILGG